MTPMTVVTECERTLVLIVLSCFWLSLVAAATAIAVTA